MVLAHSKLTAQGQISVPSEVRKRLGVGPGSVLEWQEHDNDVVVRRAGRYTSADIHAAIFKSTPPPLTPEDVKRSIRDYLRKKHAGR